MNVTCFGGRLLTPTHWFVFCSLPGSCTLVPCMLRRLWRGNWASSPARAARECFLQLITVLWESQLIIHIHHKRAGPASRNGAGEHQSLAFFVPNLLEGTCIHFVSCSFLVHRKQHNDKYTQQQLVKRTKNRNSPWGNATKIKQEIKK